MVSMIVAMDEANGIGLNNRLPWHLSVDLKRFKTLTMGHHILMGRKTYESIGKPLAGRVMVVISRQTNFRPEGCLVARSLQEALDIAGSQAETEVFIIGGGEIFSQAIGIVERIYLTRVHTIAGCDVFFPKIEDVVWGEIETSHHEADEKNDHPCTFKTLIRS
jgi:dihydrofolate reductase